MTEEERLQRDDSVKLAMELMKLGIAHKAVVELLSFPREEVWRQLSYLPYRKAKRPGAFLIDACRNHYSPPKETYYAPPQTQPEPGSSVD